MPAKKRAMPEPEPEEIQDTSDDVLYTVRNIIGETKTKYLVDWEDIGDETFEPTWEPKRYVTEAAVEEWEETKKKKQEAIKQKEEQDEKQKEQGRKNKGKGRASEVSVSSKAGAGRRSKAVEVFQLEEDDDDEDALEQASEDAVASGSKPLRRTNPTVEIRKQEQVKRGLNRPRKSLPSSTPVVAGSFGRGELKTRPKKKSSPPRKRLVRKNMDRVMIPSDDEDNDSDVPLRKSTSRKRRFVEDSDPSSEKVQQHISPAKKKHFLALDSAPPPAKRLRGETPSTPAGASRSEDMGTTEIEDSEMVDPAAAQLHRESRSARKRSPRQLWPEPEEISEFHSSQLLKGTQSEQAPASNSMDNSEPMVDAAAAYEPGTASESTFTAAVVNSSSGVHTLPLIRRFGLDVVIPDSQSHLDGSSIHIADVQMEDPEDASTESQVVVDEEATAKQGKDESEEQRVLMSSIAQVRTTHLAMTVLIWT
jgi:hypothetical protein